MKIFLRTILIIFIVVGLFVTFTTNDTNNAVFAGIATILSAFTYNLTTKIYFPAFSIKEIFFHKFGIIYIVLYLLSMLGNLDIHRVDAIYRITTSTILNSSFYLFLISHYAVVHTKYKLMEKANQLSMKIVQQINNQAEVTEEPLSPEEIERINKDLIKTLQLLKKYKISED